MRWNLRLTAAEQGIWKSSELRRRLAEAGLEISVGKMSMLWTGNPTRSGLRISTSSAPCWVAARHSCSSPNRTRSPPASPSSRTRRSPARPRSSHGWAATGAPRRREQTAAVHSMWAQTRRLHRTRVLLRLRAPGKTTTLALHAMRHRQRLLRETVVSPLPPVRAGA